MIGYNHVMRGQKKEGFTPLDFWAYWAFNNNYIGEGTNGVDLQAIYGGAGSEITTPITFVNDRFSNANKAVHFSNTLSGNQGGGYLTELSSINLGTQDMTFCFWLNVTSLVPNLGRPIGCGGFTFTSYSAFSPNTEPIINVGGINYSSNISASNLIDVWSHHLIRIKANGLTDYFYNGVANALNISLGTPSISEITLGFGVGGAPYDGAIDDFIILDRFVNDDEINLLKDFTT